ncbi:MAG: GNAT family N-acetyltransferase [Actinomycetes bacterium]
MSVESARHPDLPAILALEESFAEPRWSAQAWAEELASERGLVLVERDADGAVFGVAAFSHVGGVADLNRIVVRPDRRQRGVGRRLVLAGLEWASRIGARQVMLEVGAGNEPARALYARLGFVALARRANYYGAGHDAIVMALALQEDES